MSGAGPGDGGGSAGGRPTDLLAYNGAAWDAQVARKDRWTQPVSPEQIAAARLGTWSLVLTPQRPVPRAWYPERLDGVRTLCLASGGGQQGPILAAAGADVTVYDYSEAQLGQDRLVAAREGLVLRTVRGDMADLSAFADGSFDLIFHPVSNCFARDVRPVWRECARVLRPGGILLAGFTNPVVFAFDPATLRDGPPVLRYGVPYSDLTDLGDAELRRFTDNNEPLVCGHTLEDQIGGQLAAGFFLTALFEDRGDSPEERALSEKLPGFIATRAVRS